jgi:RpiR family transcriptional regulator, carbohydrate utilization regulator
MQDAKLLQRLNALLADSTAVMPPARRRILQLVIDDPDRVLTESFEALASRAGSSVPTVMRAVRDLGYAGLREFQLALGQDLAVSGSPLHRRVSIDDGTTQVVKKIIRSATSALQEVMQHLSSEALEAAAQAIVQAARIDCWSVGNTSSFMASDFQARLFRLGLSANAYLDQHLQLISAASLHKGSVALAISHVGAMPSMLEAVDIARAQGATVIALTQPNTPLALKANIVVAIQVPQDPVMRVGTEAYIGHLAAIEILTFLVTRQLGRPAIERLQRVHSVLNTHGLDVMHHPTTDFGDRMASSARRVEAK